VFGNVIKQDLSRLMYYILHQRRITERFVTVTKFFFKQMSIFLQTQKRMTLLSNEENKEISLSSELSQASTEKVNVLRAPYMVT